MANLEPDVHLAERVGRIAQDPIEALDCGTRQTGAEKTAVGARTTRKGQSDLTYLE